MASRIVIFGGGTGKPWASCDASRAKANRWSAEHGPNRSEYLLGSRPEIGRIGANGDMTKTYWLIQGFDSNDKIFEKRVNIGQIGDGQIEALLMALAARAGLTFDEIVGAYAKQRTKLSNSLLLVTRREPEHSFKCGENPFFTARVVRGES